MDPLALLCNLHGDGPSTLNRLRRAGHENLRGLEEGEPAELASLLGWEEPRLQRFLREARQLSVRLGEGILDQPEESPRAEPPAPQLEAVVSAEAIELEESLDAEPEEEEIEEEIDERALTSQWYEEEGSAPLEEDVQGRAAEMKEQVLERWAELDGEGEAASASDAEEPLEPMSVAETADDEPDETGLAEAGHLLVPAPRAAAPSPAPSRAPADEVSALGIPAPVALADVELDGLTPERRAKIEAAGLCTLEDLAGADDLALSRATGLPYTQAARLIFLAARTYRSLPPAPEPLTDEASDEVVAGFVEGSLDDARLDASGPFA